MTAPIPCPGSSAGPDQPARTILTPSRFAALVLLLLAGWAAMARGSVLTLYQVQSQDLAILFALPLLLLLTERFVPAGWTLPRKAPSLLLVITLGLALVAALSVGCVVLMEDFPLSRDEHMVVFDAAVYAHGYLAQPLAPEWRDFATALVPDFLLKGARPTGLVSAYLPVNPLLRTGFSAIANPVLMNPLLVLVGAIALLNIAKRLFEDDHRAIWVVLIVYASSTQMLVNSMTTYAMTGHMALNLLWLMAFLHGHRSGHALAIAIGALATGLHQVVFHPLFVAPFLLWRLSRGEWRLVLVYAFAYGCIIAGWTSYPLLAAAQAGPPVAQGDANYSFFADRVWPLLVHRNPATFGLTVLNLLRFVAWQNLALLTLIVAAVPLARGRSGIAAPLLWGVLGAIAFMAIVLPYQGHGWGYRYLHPWLGSVALLAGYGYQRWVQIEGAKADGRVLVLTLATLAGSMPMLLTTTHRFVAPHAALERAIAARRTDFVVIDTEVPSQTTDGRWAMNAVDHVRNSPDLTNRPLRLSSRNLSEDQMMDLCRRGRIGIVTRADMHAQGFARNVPEASPRFDGMVEALQGRGCLVSS